MNRVRVVAVALLLGGGTLGVHSKPRQSAVLMMIRSGSSAWKLRGRPRTTGYFVLNSSQVSPRSLEIQCVVLSPTAMAVCGL
jgi:hypothetical protein